MVLWPIQIKFVTSKEEGSGWEGVDEGGRRCVLGFGGCSVRKPRKELERRGYTLASSRALKQLQGRNGYWKSGFHSFAFACMRSMAGLGVRRQVA